MSARALAAALVGLLLLASPAARAQLGKLAYTSGAPAGGSGDSHAPVTFEADEVSYDRDRALVTASGHVVAWQNGNVLRADRVTFDRNTDVAAAYGHVALVQPDGEVLFAQYAELTQGMKEGVLKGMRALLQQNGRLAANGARRVQGKVNDLSRAVYSPCKVCAEHPDEAPFWQLRAYDATQDVEHKRIEYRDMFLDILGTPVFYFPYFSMPDPSVKRQSGFLIPDIAPSDDYLGPFFTLPYFLALGPSSDLTLTPLIASKSGPQLGAEYRRDFNDGIVRIRGALAYDSTTRTSGSSRFPQGGRRLDALEGYVFAHADFAYNQNWHYGADINLASAADYLRDYRIPGYGANVLANSIYVEGYGTGAYTRLDSLAYQGVNQYGVTNSALPFVLPRYQYDLLLPTDPLGGNLRISTQDFDIYRATGTSDQRASLVLNWDRVAIGPLGTKWTLTGNLQSEAYNATQLDTAPNYLNVNHALTAQALPTAALRVEWPLVRLAANNASQMIEPIAQVIAAPNAPESANNHLPNEDSLDYVFNDDTLFVLNRFSGVDRQDSGLRANVGLRGNWSFANGMYVDGLVGESFRAHVDNRGMFPYAGLERHASDIVNRLSFVPSRYLDFTARLRYDHDRARIGLADGLVSAGVPLLRVSAGYIYSETNPYYYYDGDYRIPAQISPGFFLPRNELTLSAASAFGPWHVSAFAQRNLSDKQYTNFTRITEGEKFVALGGNLSWQNDCFIANLNYSKRYTFINGDNGDQTILFTLTFKTLGAFGING